MRITFRDEFHAQSAWAVLRVCGVAATLTRGAPWPQRVCQIDVPIAKDTEAVTVLTRFRLMGTTTDDLTSRPQLGGSPSHGVPGINSVLPAALQVRTAGTSRRRANADARSGVRAERLALSTPS